jgi:hypothetical protein
VPAWQLSGVILIVWLDPTLGRVEKAGHDLAPELAKIGRLIQGFIQRFARLIVGIKTWGSTSTSSLEKVCEGAYPER